MTGNDVKGALCIKSVWPGMARTIYGDHQRFLNTYYTPYPGMYNLTSINTNFYLTFMILIFDDHKWYRYYNIMSTCTVDVQKSS